MLRTSTLKNKDNQLFSILVEKYIYIETRKLTLIFDMNFDFEKFHMIYSVQKLIFNESA